MYHKTYLSHFNPPDGQGGPAPGAPRGELQLRALRADGPGAAALRRSAAAPGGRQGTGPHGGRPGIRERCRGHNWDSLPIYIYSIYIYILYIYSIYIYSIYIYIKIVIYQARGPVN